MVSSYKSVRRPEYSNIFLFQVAAARLRAVAAQRKPAIDGDCLTSDVIVRLEKETHGAGDIFRASEARHGAAGDVPIVFTGLHAGGGHPDGGGSGSDYVHADTIPLLCQYAGRVDECCLRRGVIQAGWKHRERLHGGEQHHTAAVRASLHRGTEVFCQQNWPHVVGFQRGDESFTIQIFEGNAGWIAWEDDNAREWRRKSLCCGKVG